MLFLSISVVAIVGLSIQSELKSKSFFSPLNLFCFLIALHVGIPAICHSLGFDLIVYSPNGEYTNTVLIYIILNLFVLRLANIFTKNKLSIIKINSVWRDRNVKIVLLIFLAIGIITRLFLISNNSYFQIYRGSEYNLTGDRFLSFYMLFERLPSYALIIVFIHRYVSKTKSKFWIRASYFLIAFELLYWFPAGRKEEIISTLIYPFIISVLLLQKLPSKKIMLLSGLFVILVFPVTRLLRVGILAIVISGQSITNINDVISVIPEAVSIGQEINKKKTDEKFSSLKRISLLESMSAAVRLSEKNGYKYGQSYNSIFYSIVPRFIWPNKPKSTTGIEFGIESGIASKNDTSSISVTYLGESYYNFGFFGVFISLFVFLLMNYLYKLSFGKGNPIFILIFIMAIKPYVYIGGELSPYFTGYFKSLLLFLPVFFFLNYKKLNKN